MSMTMTMHAASAIVRTYIIEPVQLGRPGADASIAEPGDGRREVAGSHPVDRSVDPSGGPRPLIAPFGRPYGRPAGARSSVGALLLAQDVVGMPSFGKPFCRTVMRERSFKVNRAKTFTSSP